MRAKQVLSSGNVLVTSDHILLETWLLLRHRLSRKAAEQLWQGLREGAARIEVVTPSDLDAAWRIGRELPDQDFSLADRTSFALMQRLGIHQAASFDDDFAVFRFGPGSRRAFEVLR